MTLLVSLFEILTTFQGFFLSAEVDVTFMEGYPAPDALRKVRGSALEVPGWLPFPEETVDLAKSVRAGLEVSFDLAFARPKKNRSVRGSG